MGSSGSNPEVRRPSKRGDSFVRDGYEITIEDIYHVNGRKKKKVKKRKLTKQQLQDSESKLHEGQELDPQHLLNRLNLDIDRELEAIEQMSQQTRELEAGKKLQNHVSSTPKMTSANSQKELPFDAMA